MLVSPCGDTTGALDRILVDFGLKRRIALLVATYLAVPAAMAPSVRPHLSQLCDIGLAHLNDTRRRA